MPDFGAPIAQNVDVSPQKGIQTLGELMGLQQKQIGIAQQQQNLATGQFLQQQQQAEAQRQQQAMGTRQAATKMAQTGLDLQGNSIRGDDGEIDPVKFSTSLNRIDPVNAAPITQNIIKTLADKFTLQSSALKLDAAQRQMLQGPLQALNLDPSDDNITNARNVIGQLVSAHPEMVKTANAANSLLDHLGNIKDPAGRSKAANSFSSLFQAGAPVETQPRAGQLDTGPAIQAGTVAAPAAGGGFTAATTTTKGLAPQIIMDAAGQPHFIGAASAAPAGGVGGSSFPSTPQVQAQKAAADDMTNHFTGLNASAQSLPLVTSLTKTIESLAPSAFTGPGGDKRQYMAGLARVFGVNLTGDAQTDTNLMNKAMAQLNISTPAGTDAARALIEAGQPNSHMDAAAIREAAGTVAGQVRMNAAERNFLQTTRLSNRGAGDPMTYQQGRQAFEANADPRIWQYEELAKNNPAGARAFISRQPDKADLIRKTSALEQMGFFR